MRNDIDRAVAGRQNCAPAVRDFKRHRFGASSGGPVLCGGLVSVSHAQKNSRCQRLRNLGSGVLVKTNPQRVTKQALVVDVDAANHDVGGGVVGIVGGYAVPIVAVVGGVTVVMHITIAA